MDGTMKIRRRKFLSSTVAAAAASSSPFLFPSLVSAKDKSTEVAARYWEPLEDKAVRCRLCPRGCEVPEGARGFCRVRENRGGKYYTLVHSHPCALHNVEIERKPFFHYKPGSLSMSLATAGCNFRCKFCQNWEISQSTPEEVESITLSPKSFVDRALEEGSESVCFTYSEPTVYYEYMFDCAKLAREKGLGAVAVSNGFIRGEPLKALLEFKKGIWFEVVNLVIPTLNDSPEEKRAMSRWIIQELGGDVPLHFTRFHPTYKLNNLPPTPVKTLERCREIALESGLRFVYLGNVMGHPAENTYCPTSGKLLIERMGFSVLKNFIVDGKCPCCGKPVPGVWK
jgi:pyruvate formate lyase activating enzyme